MQSASHLPEGILLDLHFDQWQDDKLERKTRIQLSVSYIQV